jgi:hypothetical protein
MLHKLSEPHVHCMKYRLTNTQKYIRIIPPQVSVLWGIFFCIKEIVMTMYRQGDILLVSDDKTKLQKPTIRKDKVVAYGEVTGHKHEFEGNVLLLENYGNTYADVMEEAKLVHDEHETIIIPEGFYRIIRQREYDGENIRQVVD